MKKSLVVIFILVLLFPLIVAVEVDLKEELKMGETFSAEFSGNFIDPILKENIAFYRVTSGKHTEIPADYEVLKIDEEYYVWAILPEKEDNYTIEIKDVRHKTGTTESTEDIITNFTVIAEKASFQINPAVVYTRGDFEILIQNMLNEKISVDIETSTISGDVAGFWFLEESITSENDATVNLKSGESEKVKFRADAITLPSMKSIAITSGNTEYTIPVYIFKNVSQNISLPKIPEIDYRFEMVKIDFEMATSVNKTGIVYIKNYGEDVLSNITLSLSGVLKKYVEMSIENISELKEDESRKIELYFSSGIEEKELDGQLSASIESEDYIYLPISFEIIYGYVDENGSSIIGIENYTGVDPQVCIKCDSDEVCDGALDEYGCCISRLCEENADSGESSKTGKIIGWVIIVVIVLFSIWFFKFKYKGTKRKKIDLLKSGRKKL